MFGVCVTALIVYATIPDYGKRSVRHYIDYKFPSAVFAITEGFHRVLPNLTLRSHDLQQFAASGDFINEQHARCELLYDILAASKRNRDGVPETTCKKTLVFTKSIASADALFEFLQNDKNLTNCALFHKDVDRAQRQQLIKRLDSAADADQDLVVICTDIAARGLDTTKVGHVVQFEFASDIVSYLHRIGRTGRAGTTGNVTSITSSENSLVLAKIQEAGQSTLQNVFSRKRSLRKKFKKSLRPRNSDN
uniref:ATP-dependent RNA helicase n=1 Tax=Peronospora matthiolae TaxID=2874970 RepID=A0AAV1T5I5_9STRA